MLADVGLHANGYRTLTSRPGHHQTAIQTLPTTLGIDSQTLVRLDHLRKQRNLTEYTRDLIPATCCDSGCTGEQGFHSNPRLTVLAQ